MIDRNKEVGRWLIRQRWERDLTQKEVGIRMGIGPKCAQQKVSSIENSTRTTSVTQFLNYCKAVGVTGDRIAKFYDNLK